MEYENTVEAAVKQADTFYFPGKYGWRENTVEAAVKQADGSFVLILVLMEYENTQQCADCWSKRRVLILVLMEYENTQ